MKNVSTADGPFFFQVTRQSSIMEKVYYNGEKTEVYVRSPGSVTSFQTSQATFGWMNQVPSWSGCEKPIILFYFLHHIIERIKPKEDISAWISFSSYRDPFKFGAISVRMRVEKWAKDVRSRSPWRTEAGISRQVDTGMGVSGNHTTSATPAEKVNEISD